MAKHVVVMCDDCQQEVIVPQDGTTVTCGCAGTTWSVRPMRIVERKARESEQ